MKLIKCLIILSVLSIVLWSCGSNLKSITPENTEQPVVIANDSLEYEIIVIDPGFNAYLNSIALPRGHYNQQYLEARNRVWVVEWNLRFRQPLQFNPNIYENEIEYFRNIDYGYEVNYLLFNYFLFAQRKYNMNLGGGFRVERIN